MSLARYADECRGLAEELIESLDEDEVADLRRQLYALGYVRWREWRETHARRVAAYVAAAPSARAKRKGRSSDHLPLVLAAYQHCQQAGDLLREAIALEPGCSYRQMAADAGAAHLRLQDHEWSEWPWDQPDPYDDRAFYEKRA